MLKNIVTFTNANKPQRNVVLLVHDKLNFGTIFFFVWCLMRREQTNDSKNKKKLTMPSYKEIFRMVCSKTKQIIWQSPSYIVNVKQ